MCIESVTRVGPVDCLGWRRRKTPPRSLGREHSVVIESLPPQPPQARARWAEVALGHTRSPPEPSEPSIEGIGPGLWARVRPWGRRSAARGAWGRGGVCVSHPVFQSRRALPRLFNTPRAHLRTQPTPTTIHVPDILSLLALPSRLPPCLGCAVMEDVSRRGV